MRGLIRRSAVALVLGGVLAWSGQVASQRPAGAHHGQGGPRGNAEANRNINHNVNRNGNRSANRNVNRNGTRTVNRNVNHNVNVNVNRNVDVRWNGHSWGGRPIYGPRYAWPRGYAYVRRPVGWVMPRPFLTAAYFYTAWATLGLVAPPHNFQWVRYGPDLLLVDTTSGRVTDVRYGVFAG